MAARLNRSAGFVAVTAMLVLFMAATSTGRRPTWSESAPTTRTVASNPST